MKLCMSETLPFVNVIRTITLSPIVQTCPNALLKDVKDDVCQFSIETYEPRHEKTNVLVSDLVRHKPDCSATEDG